MRDLIGFVDRCFHTIPDRSGRVIGGLSMGGHGAMKLGLKHPDLFRSITSFSAPFQIFHKWEDWMDPQWQAMLGAKKAARANDVFALATKLKGKRTPAIRFDCGTEDGLLEHNRALARHLRRLKIEHEYEEFPGGHDWSYWDLRIREALAFHCRVLGIEQPQ